MRESGARADEWQGPARVVLAAILVSIALGGTAPYFEALLDANERPRLLAGIALVEAGSVEVDGPWSAGVGLGPDLAEAEDGSLVPNKPPGATLVASGAYLVLRDAGGGIGLRAYTIGARILGGLVPTLILAGLWWRREREWAGHLARMRGQDVGPVQACVDLALVAWLLATPAWANAKLLFGHSLAACLLGCGLSILGGRPGRRVGPAAAAGAGALMGAAVAVEYTAAFAGPVIGVYLIWRERERWPVIAAALAGALVPIAGLAGYHDAVFGSPWTTGYHRAAHDAFAQIHGRGLLGLQLPSATSLYEHLISPWGGLLVWAPLCLLGLLAGAHAAFERNAEAKPEPSVGAEADVDGMADARARQLLFVTVAGALLVVLVGLEQGGGWRVGPRYYVLAMPLTIPGLVVLLHECQRRERGLALTLVLGLAFAATWANFMAANWFPHLIPHGNPLGDLLVPLIGAGRRVHGLGPGLVGACALGLWGWAWIRWTRQAQAPRWAYFAGLGLGVALLAAQILGPPSDPLAELELEGIERMWEPDAGGEVPPTRQLMVD